jgi:cell division protein FtsQ
LPWLGALLGSACLLAGGWWLVWDSTVLAITEVRVVGVDGKGRQQVLASAGVPIGRPLATFDAEATSARVSRIDWVRTATAERSWPHEALITVEVRTALAVDTDSGQAVDVDGVRFMPVDGVVDGLPVVRGSDQGRQEAMRALAQMPEGLVSRITSISANGRDDIYLVLKSGSGVRWGSAEQTLLKAEVLGALLNRKAVLYDVAAPLMPTTRGERRS